MRRVLIVTLVVPSMAWAQDFYVSIGGGLGHTQPTFDGQPGEEDVGYRYVHINHGAVEQFQGGSPKHVEFDVIQNHSLELGLAMRF